VLGFKVLVTVLQAGFDRHGMSPVALPLPIHYCVGRQFHYKISVIPLSKSAVLGFVPRAIEFDYVNLFLLT